MSDDMGVVGGQHPMSRVQITLASRKQRGRIDIEHGGDTRSTKIVRALYIPNLITDAPIPRAGERTGSGSAALWEYIHLCKSVCEFNGAWIEAIAFDERSAWDQLPLADCDALAQR